MTELHDPTPINFGHAGCASMVRWHVGQWASCPAEPTHAGYVRPKQFHRRRVRVFTCPDHATQVEGAQPMSDEDRAELDGRRVQMLRALAGLK